MAGTCPLFQGHWLWPGKGLGAPGDTARMAGGSIPL